MDLKEYKDCLKNTLEEMYPIYVKKAILNKLKENGLIINDKRKTNAKQISLITTNVSEIEGENEKLKFILDSEKFRAYKYVEEFEYDKEYRHCCFFEIKGDFNDITSQLLEDNQIQLFVKDNDAYDSINQILSKPTIRIVGQSIYIKYSKLLTNRENKGVKYVVLCIIHPKDRLLEIRLDKIGGEYKNGKGDFYADIIDRALVDIKRLYKIEIQQIDFKAIIAYVQEEKDDVTVYAQKMTRNGSTAYLEASDGVELVIPILGELKQFIESNSDVFSKNKETIDIRNKLEKFIGEIEIKSDLPMVKITWPQKQIRIGFVHNYKDRAYSFIMYYDELIVGKERNEYVREYLNKCYRELEEQIQPNAISS